MNENQFLEVMRKHSDDELLEILNVKRSDYAPDAIAAVEEVLKERGVSYEKVSDEIIYAGDRILTIEKIKVDNTRRLLGHIIDTAFVIFIATMILTLATLYGSTIDNLGIDLAYYAFYFLYFFVAESLISNGKTIGKWLLRMRVVNEKGECPAMSKMRLRTLCRFIPFDALSFLWGGNWHDSISGTYVVSDKGLERLREQNNK